ncbi:hypothetical protein EZW68_21100 [Salmonella enterica subsp. enterica serovar Typhimurium]|nr:hypothetical protein [Salmonella enterica subsp. enterica serovar Typhimurium]ECF0308895.1 hypothetical protein [Salmonella enterica subsp. enterica serovar Typhimurium]
MPQLARAPASLRRPGALQQGGALYCACERQRATGAAFGKRTILYGCAIAVGCTPTLYGLWQTFREMR